jgi:hypothetical protein
MNGLFNINFIKFRPPTFFGFQNSFFRRNNFSLGSNGTAAAAAAAVLKYQQELCDIQQ